MAKKLFEGIQKATRKVAQLAGGYEKPDPTPTHVDTGLRPPVPIEQQIRRMIRSERLAQEALQQGQETFEEADDFDIGDDYDPKSPYEQDFDQETAPYQRGDFIEEKPEPKVDNDSNESLESPNPDTPAEDGNPQE